MVLSVLVIMFLVSMAGAVAAAMAILVGSWWAGLVGAAAVAWAAYEAYLVNQ